MIPTLIYVHGTNGSGKSTLARAVMAAAGGSTGFHALHTRDGKGGFTSTKEGVALIGKYGAACGGVDGVHPYALVEKIFRMDHVYYAFAEGLITPGVETCKRFAECFDRTVFIHLDTPIEDCIANVLKRRKAKGNAKPFDPTNLRKKAGSAKSWADRCEAAGLNVERLNYRQAYARSLELLGLHQPSVDDLL